MTIHFGDGFSPDYKNRLKPPPAAPERRERGQLTYWTEGASFGFITPLGSPKSRETDVFVHRSALKAAGITEAPSVGLLLDYVIGLGDNGRERAVKVYRAATVER